MQVVRWLGNWLNDTDMSLTLRGWPVELAKERTKVIRNLVGEIYGEYWAGTSSTLPFF